MDLFENRAQGLNLALAISGAFQHLNGLSTFPVTAVGLRFKHQISDAWSVKAGLLNGEADNPDARNTTGFVIDRKYGAFGIGEVDYTPSKYTKLMAGVWGYSGEFQKFGEFNADFSPKKTYGEVGAYVGGATRLYAITGTRGVDAFFNVGVAPETTNIIGQSYDAGITVTGLFGARPTDKLGVAVAVGEIGRGFRGLLALEGATDISKYATNFEFTYRAHLTDWLVVQPEVQYIMHPSLLPNVKNAFVFGLHFEVNKIFHD